MEQINEIYERQEDGSTILVKSEVIIVPQEVLDQQIKDKEEELLRMYQELKELKTQV